MIVGVLNLDLLIHGAQSLKQKRSLVSKLLNRVRSKFPVSAAEVGSMDLWQRCQIGVSMVSSEEALISRTFLKIEEQITQSGLAEVIGSQVEFLHYSESTD